MKINWSGPLTAEDPKATEDEHARWLANHQLETHRATEVRPCPSWQRLDALMGGAGKVEADAWTPSQMMPWWRA